MSAQIRVLPSNTTGAEVADALVADGCVIVEKFATESDMDRLRSDLARWLDGRDLGNNDFSGYKTRRVSALVARSEIAQSIAVQPTVLDVCDRLLLPNCNAYRLQVTHMVDIGPGEIRQEIHRDDGIFPPIFHQALPGMHALVHCMYAVSDFTAENGATTLVPGSHQWSDRERQPEDHEITQAVMSKGSVAFYLGRTLHGGGANRADDRRVGALFGYALGWLRQEENMYLTCPPELARAYPERLQRVLGYDLFSTGAGWVDNANPRILLEDDFSFDRHRAY